MKRGLLAVLILAILGVSGFVGWKYWQNKPDKKSTNTHQTNNDPSEGEKYLLIKEWGIKVPYGVHVSNLTRYNLVNGDNLYFYENGLQDKLNVLSDEEKLIFNTCVAYPQLTISRIKTKDIAINSAPIYLKNPIKTIGEYGYFVLPPQATCPNIKTNVQVESLINDYVEAPYANERAEIIRSFE